MPPVLVKLRHSDIRGGHDPVDIRPTKSPIKPKWPSITSVMTWRILWCCRFDHVVGTVSVGTIIHLRRFLGTNTVTDAVYCLTSIDDLASCLLFSFFQVSSIISTLEYPLWRHFLWIPSTTSVCELIKHSRGRQHLRPQLQKRHVGALRVFGAPILSKYFVSIRSESSITTFYDTGVLANLSGRFYP